jgi:hypothetical protein
VSVGRLTVAFDDPTWNADLARLGQRGAEIAKRARADLERNGVAISDLLKCDAEGRDGTRLDGCVKLYLDQWGLVFTPDVSPTGEPRLLCIALGVRHPPVNSPRWSVYQHADRRLNVP